MLFAGWRQDAKPSRIDDHEGRQWVVERVVDYGACPNRESGTGRIPYGIEAERWRLVVVGPLPRTGMVRANNMWRSGALAMVPGGTCWSMSPDPVVMGPRCAPVDRWSIGVCRVSLFAQGVETKTT